MNRVFETGIVPANAARSGLEVSVAGWVGDRKRITRPVMFQLIKSPGRRWRRRSGVPRHILPGRVHFQFSPAANVSREDRDYCGERMSKAGMIADSLVDTIRRVAARHPNVIGNELMAVAIEHPRRRVIDIHFTPLEPIKMMMYGKPTEIAYTPWILSPVAWAAPAIIVGSQSLPFGGWRVNLRAPRSTGAILGGMYPQRRKALP